MLLLGGACAVLLLMPWHGPIILSLSWSHGIHAGDLAALPLFALAVGYLQANDGWRAAGWPAGRWAVSAYAVLLGALLVLAGVGARLISSSSAEPLLPAGGGAFDGSTVHADARRAVPVNRWSHLALTYDGATLRLYVNGSQASSQGDHRHHQEDNRPPVDWGYPTLWGVLPGPDRPGARLRPCLKPSRTAGRDVDPERERPALAGRGPRCCVRFRQGLGDGGSRRLGQRQRGRDHRSDLGTGGADSVVRCGSTAPARECACPRQRR